MGPFLHPWNVDRAEARRLQERLAARVVARTPRGFRPALAAALDCQPCLGGRAMVGAVVVFRPGRQEVLESAWAVDEDPPPYVPGYLSFRECPVLLEALRRLAARCDLFFCDGQGLAHPRRFGLACHLGLHTGLPTVGVAKSRLVGEHDEPGPARGDHVPLLHRGEVVGAVLRTRPATRPLYVSVGHRVALRRAVSLVLAVAGAYRVPWPLRAADRLAREVARALEEGTPPRPAANLRA